MVPVIDREKEGTRGGLFDTMLQGFVNEGRPLLRNNSDFIIAAHNLPINGELMVGVDMTRSIAIVKEADVPYSYYFKFRVKFFEDCTKDVEEVVTRDRQLVELLEKYGFKKYGVVSREYWMER